MTRIVMAISISALIVSIEAMNKYVLGGWSYRAALLVTLPIYSVQLLLLVKFYRGEGSLIAALSVLTTANWGLRVLAQGMLSSVSWRELVAVVGMIAATLMANSGGAHG